MNGSPWKFLRWLFSWPRLERQKSNRDWLDEMDWPYEDDPDWPVR